MSGKTAHPFARPFYMMAKPAGSACNLACSYCYYLEKKYLYSQANSYLMDDELLEKFISEYMESVTGPEVYSPGTEVKPSSESHPSTKKPFNCKQNMPEADR